MENKKTVIVSGIRGQAGSYAADKFLSEGYRVIGISRRCSMPDFSNIQHNLDNPDFILYEADICDFSSISGVINKFRPDMFLNFAAMSHVGSSYNQPLITQEVNYIGVANILEAIRLIKPDIKFWQASTSERMGNTEIRDQNEDSKPEPISPYSVSKIASEYLINAYCYTYGIYATYSINFNFESPRRSKAFVTRKITDYIGKTFNIVEKNLEKLFQPVRGFHSVQDSFDKALEMKIIEPLRLGNIDSSRSWTHCTDIINGVYAQMQLSKPDIFVFGLEEVHTVRQFLDEAFISIGITDWSKFVVQDQNFIRPSDVKYLKPDCSKAKRILNWTPKYNFHQLVKEMVDADIERYTNDRT